MRLIIISILLTFLNYSYSQKELKVVDFRRTSCDRNADISRIQPRIIEQKFYCDTFEVRIGTIANCSGISHVKSSLINDTLFINYRQGSSYIDTTYEDGEMVIEEAHEIMMCDCCFEFNFTISSLNIEPNYIKINNKLFKHYPDKYKICPISFDIVNGDTVNYKDKFGFKQGKWTKVERDEEYFYKVHHYGNNYKLEAFYIDNKRQTLDFKLYYQNGNLKMRIKQPDLKNLIKEKYYENGKLDYQIIDNGKRRGQIYNYFFESGALKIMDIWHSEFREKIEYYEDGKLRSIWNKFIDREYYPNGVLIPSCVLIYNIIL